MAWPSAELPLRSLLFVPGDSAEKIAKAWSRGADCILLDLEDSVSEAAKGRARENARKALETAPEGGVPAFVRINHTCTPHWREDLKAVVGRRLRGILLPKCESRDEVAAVSEWLEQQEKDMGLADGSFLLLLLLESTRGILRASELAESDSRVAALAFGAEDYCRDLGTAPSSREPLLYPRSLVAICARAHRCLAIDSPFIDFNDSDGLRRDTEAARTLGYSGKLAIHPRQLEVIHQAFAPTEREVAEAREIVEAFAAAEGRGLAVAALRGRMIDRPIVERARQTLAAADLCRRR